MQVSRRPRPGVQVVPSGCVATIGVFDGVHLGHRRILDRVLDQAGRLGLPSLVFSFEPTPQEAMGTREPPARLMRFREKYHALAAIGIDHLHAPPFDRSLQEQSPAEFIDGVLVGKLGVRHLVVGDDFRFARGRAGRFADLEAGARRHGFGLEQVGSVTVDGLRVSSTAIRHALATGDLERAGKLLGKPYRMIGRVDAGRRLGRELGFPTANLRLGRRVSPVQGIFAVRVLGLGPVALDGVASVGTRPTVQTATGVGGEPLLEVHVFDFDRDIYRQRIAVDFIARLRDEVLFPDLQSLRREMERDAIIARRLLAASPR